MVRFSCFNGHIHSSQKSKTTVEQSMEAMLKALQDSTKVQDVKTSTAQPTSLNSVFLRSKTDTHINYEEVLDSEEIEQTSGVEIDPGICHGTLLKRSKSLGDELCHEGRIDYNKTEEETDQGGSSDCPDQNGSGGAREGSPTSQYDKAPLSESVQVGSDIVNDGSVFSAGDSHRSNKEVPGSCDNQLFGLGADNSDVPSPPRPTRLERSRSFPNFRSASLSPGAHTGYLAGKSKSWDDLRGLYMGWKDLPVHEAGTQSIHDKDCRSEGNNFENLPDDVYDSYDYSSPAKDWVMPVADEDENLAEEQLERVGGSSMQQPGEYPNEDFRFRRIKAWVNDLHSCGPVDEAVVLPGIDELVSTEPSTVSGRPTTVVKVDDKMTSSMEAAKRYVQSLSPATTTAQLSNHGLAVIPALGAFGSLRVLNLSGNSVARITAGVLPRGLHMLNLAKNNISTIEGLRELTRLRVLDLSYNRIFRIGHGLGSCSSLKELYLAGNKISEVEGLHRLLKLTVLDLRFNKLSTTKCLGQLAANYSSLQAISLEGNPAQKNVGDEQLKKHLQGLLPQLIYFNRQATKAGTLKDAADRSVRLGISSNKSVRKAGHGVTASRALSSSTHGGRASTSSPKRSKGRHVKLPPSGTGRPSGHARPPVQGLDLGRRVVDFRAELAMRRSKSEGHMGPQ